MDIIEKFNMYRESHPNLSQCWIAYLGLKKRHYGANYADERTLAQCDSVLETLKNGCADWNQKDIISILLYKQSLKTSSYNL